MKKSVTLSALFFLLAMSFSFETFGQCQVAYYHHLLAGHSSGTNQYILASNGITGRATDKIFLNGEVVLEFKNSNGNVVSSFSYDLYNLGNTGTCSSWTSTAPFSETITLPSTTCDYTVDMIINITEVESTNPTDIMGSFQFQVGTDIYTITDFNNPYIFTIPNIDTFSTPGTLEADITRFGNNLTAHASTCGSGPFTYNWSTFRGGNITGSTTTQTITMGSTGTYCVTITDTSGQTATDCMEVTAIFSSSFKLSQGAKDKSTSPYTQVYPNPVKDILVINTPDEIFQIKMFNAAGQLVLQKDNLKNNQLDLSNLKQGIYAIQVFTKTEQITKQIIKQ